MAETSLADLMRVRLRVPLTHAGQTWRASQVVFVSASRGAQLVAEGKAVPVPLSLRLDPREER